MAEAGSFDGRNYEMGAGSGVEALVLGGLYRGVFVCFFVLFFFSLERKRERGEEEEGEEDKAQPRPPFFLKKTSKNSKNRPSPSPSPRTPLLLLLLPLPARPSATTGNPLFQPPHLEQSQSQSESLYSVSPRLFRLLWHGRRRRGQRKSASPLSSLRQREAEAEEEEEEAEEEGLE